MPNKTVALDRQTELIPDAFSQTEMILQRMFFPWQSLSQWQTRQIVRTVIFPPARSITPDNRREVSTGPADDRQFELEFPGDLKSCLFIDRVEYNATGQKRHQT